MAQNNSLEQRLQRIESLLLSQKTLFTIDEVAEYTNLSKSYIYKLTSSNCIPHYKPSGKLVYFEKKEIDKWLMRNPVKTNEEINNDASNYITKNSKVL